MSSTKNNSNNGSSSNRFMVKNRAPAPIQISAEQIVREAADRQVDAIPEPIVQVHDAEEYQQHLADRRKLFEDNIRYRREHIGNWVKYARFEEEHQQMDRARSVMERALEVDYRSAELWLRYVELELRNEYINHARNILDRAVQLLPRVDFLWYKYVWVEEMAGDIPKCRAVFERWMKWHPDDTAWMAYARFEMRQNQQNVERAEQILRRYVQNYPTANAYIKFAKWAEYEAHNVVLSRKIYETAFTTLEPEQIKGSSRLFAQFALMEERQQEYDRARVIYQHAISLLRLSSSGSGSTTNEKIASMNDNDDNDDDDNDISSAEREKRQKLYQQYVTFEKKHGHQNDIEHVIFVQQRDAYIQHLTKNDPYDYDSWLDYAKLCQDHHHHHDDNGSVSVSSLSKSNAASSSSAAAMVRDVYEQAVANVPPDDQQKNDWRRYIYVWIYYAIYEEMQCRDLDRAVSVYETCLKVIPHKNFSFAKIWILLAQLHVRRHDLKSARSVLGRAIGMCGKERIYTEYIAIELALGEIDRCRTLYSNYVKAMPHNTSAWCSFAQLEQSVGESERCRAIYELAVTQETLDRPEVVWKAYIDWEMMEEGDGTRVRALYQRLLDKTHHVKVWISWAQFECTRIGNGIDAARHVFETAYKQLKQQQQEQQDDDNIHNYKEDRVLLLDAWRVMEKTNDGGTTESVANVEAMLPRRIKRKRLREDEHGNAMGWEEYFDYQFPDDVDNTTTSTGGGTANAFKMLEMVAQWKEQQQQQNNDDDDSDDDSD